jgi:hypothetical protein
MTCPHSSPCPRATAPRWSREAIRAARRAPLPPLLLARGFHLRDTGAGNYHIREHPDILVKDCFWRDPLSQRAGNTIDFFVTVLGMSFAQAMDAISAQP